MRFSFLLDFILGRYGACGVVLSFFGMLWFLSGREIGPAAACGLGLVICLFSLRGMIKRERRQIRTLSHRLAKLEPLPFDEACAKVPEDSVPIGGELARMREFPSPPPKGRHRYFEFDEIVFRIEEMPDGRARVVLQKLKFA
jgi:hypothetical protein